LCAVSLLRRNRVAFGAERTPKAGNRHAGLDEGRGPRFNTISPCTIETLSPISPTKAAW